MNTEERQMTDRDALLRTLDEMKDEIEKQKGLLEEKDGEIEKLRKLLADGGVGMKQDSEARPDDRKDGLEAVYGLVSCLEKYTTEEVLFYAAQILSEEMDGSDVAIYTVANRDYARLFSATSPEARKLGNSIKYTDMGDLYDALKNGRIYMNGKMEPEFPLMAGAVYAEEEIRVILMFWGIPSRRLNPSAEKRLTVLMALLQNAILRASRYMSSFRRKRYLEGTNVLNEEAFTILVKSFFKAKEKGLTECTLVEIKMGYEDYESISIQVTGSIRQTDYMGLMEGGRLYILLSNTDLKNAGVVQERLHKLGYRSRLRESVTVE